GAALHALMGEAVIEGDGVLAGLLVHTNLRHCEHEESNPAGLPRAFGARNDGYVTPVAGPEPAAPGARRSAPNRSPSPAHKRGGRSSAGHNRQMPRGARAS